MKYVYVLKSLRYQGQRYVGVTGDLRLRLAQHNAGASRHTSKFRPSAVETYVAFSDEKKAEAFEKYLKSGAGWAFLLKRF